MGLEETGGREADGEGEAITNSSSGWSDVRLGRLARGWERPENEDAFIRSPSTVGVETEDLRGWCGVNWE